MYQLEVRRWLVVYRFPPAAGWRVYVDVDAMERATGGAHPPDKPERTRMAEEALCEMSAKVDLHPKSGRVDLVAERPDRGVYLVEVEVDSARQKEQAVYRALGQILMRIDGRDKRYAVAVPGEPDSIAQVKKVPAFCREALGLSLLAVTPEGVEDVQA